INKPIYELSLTLSNEQYLMQSMNNTQLSFSSSPLTCIHHEFTHQVMKHPQKLAVELDEQSLTYAELLHYVQILSLALVNDYHIFPDEVVCQCVERSVSMVIGIMGIEMAGGVYCPLSPRDPEHRLHALTQQTQSHFVLVHNLTKTKFDHDIVSLDIDSVLSINDIEKKDLSSVIMKGEEIAYIIFTSGSTGTPKAVQVRHQNFIDCINSLVYINSFNKNDTVVQMTRCSFDIHVQEILGTLLIGGTLIMLHPGGTIDFDYLSKVLQSKQITYMHTVPSFLHMFFIFIEQNKNINAIKYLRSLCSIGEAFVVHLVDLVIKSGITNCIVWNLYGPAETTIVSTFHRVDLIKDTRSVSIGRPLSNYRCMIMNQYLQLSVTDEEGELCVGGVGVFAGYLGRDDLTAKALLEVDGKLFYRTGDLVRIDNNSLLHYQGRKDHQIKLHGQRIELGEIEQCLLRTSISACVVIKWKDDYLIAYAQSSHVNEEQLRQHCQSHLPPHMIPSFFIILDKLPLNPNGKVDRKLLPPPHFSSIHLTNSIELLRPTNDIEVSIHHIWCEIFKQNQISMDTNIFTIGGHSLLIMQLFHRYKIEFRLETNALFITDLFQRPTIIDHAQLLQQSINTIHTLYDYPWSSLHLIQARASFPQERIYLDEQIRFSSKKTTMKNMYVIPLLYRISSINDHISITRLHHAFQSVITKHNILRTALYIDDANGNIVQHCLDANIILNENVNETIEEILNQSDLFDLSKGHVINCHILRRDQSNHSFTQNNDNLLSKDDLILFTIHHACFDGASTSIFIRDLSLAYQSHDLLPVDDNSLQYIDYSVHEHIMDMTLSQEFWQSELKGYDLVHQLSLPVDRQRLPTDQRSGLASTAQITFDDEICRSFLNYASSHHLTLFQLGLSIFYVFLFKLTHGETDLCISSINANRYRSELVNMIGMFVSTLPYRAELDPHWSFDKAVKYVQEKCLSILEHSHYPLQHILADLHVTQSNISFLETMFDFITVLKEVTDLCLNGVNLEEVSLKELYEMAKFDFSLTFVYNPSSDGNQLSCCFVCSSDIFDATTAAVIGRRLKYLCEQIFDTPVSFAQHRIWFENQTDADTNRSPLTIYNIPFFYRLYTGDILSVKQLRHALQLIVNKHESLHTSLIYGSNKNILMQRVLTQQDINNDMFTITESTYETQEQLNDIIENEKCNPQLFDLTQGLVFRCHIIYYKQISSNNILSDKDIIIFSFHHAFFDYPSINIFLHDLDHAYKTGQLTTDNTTTLRYIDYAVIEQQMSMIGASMYWLNTLYDCHLDQSLSLPYDRYSLANEHRTSHATSISFDFGQDLSHQFLTYASSNNIKHEHLALAVYFIFLFKLTNGEKDLCISINIDNRYRDELKSIIGLFENVIPLRCQLDPHWSFQYLHDYVREITTNSMKYSYFPLQRILNEHPNVSKPAFLDTSLKFFATEGRNTESETVIGDSRAYLMPLSIKIDADDIMSNFGFILINRYDRSTNQLSCTINASIDLFNAETVYKTSQQFHSMMHQLSIFLYSQPKKPIYELSLILPRERLFLQSINNTQRLFSSSICVHHEFIYQAMKYSQKLAVELDEQSLTYAEFLYYSQCISLYLLYHYNVKSGDIVCQCVERSLAMVIGILAIAMVGGVYCPLSPQDPPQRLQALLNQTHSRLVMVHFFTNSIFEINVVRLNIDTAITITDIYVDINLHKLSKVSVTPEHIVFTIFTSGSTGIPKAVQLCHRNFTEFMHSFIYAGILSKCDTIIQMARCSFDNHLLSLVGTLIAGGTLIMLRPNGNMDLEYLAEVLNQKQITVMHCVPSLLNSFFTFIKENRHRSAVKWLRSLCSGGETLNMKVVNILKSLITNKCQIRNHYGPAEITINCACHAVDLDKEQMNIPIGRPLPNYRCLIVDEFSQNVYVGHEGELLVGGVGIFAGYLERDDLTAKVLININEQIFYKTGDLVHMDNKGLIHYVGRKDYQIKLHGQRIELGEIERCLLKVPSISTCVVMKWNDDYLVAYVQNSDINEQELREHCQSHLPPHMIPSVFIILEKLPLNANGKVNRKLLPPPSFLSLTDNINHNLPRNTLEQKLQNIFSQALHIESPHVEVPFGQLGGTSLDAIFVLTLIRQQICNKVDISLLFTNPSIRQLAQAIEPVLSFEELQDIASTVNEIHETNVHL
ncbi:unnamed protein product, partial [Adineta steineri]